MSDNGYSATYSPEDNKLRLYVGRVPRDEYEKLRAEGWTSTPKQNCNFVATWTPTRRDTALEYAGIIEDEDMGPDERAADRAERFGGYRDKRTDEATGHADRYDAGPSAHGYQSASRAERSAARHDRIAGRAVDSWSKAEYWVQRTAGVISHALYVSSPSVRMGRIKTLEAELRKARASITQSQKRYDTWQKIANEPDAAKQAKFAIYFANNDHDVGAYPHPVALLLFTLIISLAARLIETLELRPGSRILEPSAGLGRLLDALQPFDPSEVVAVDVAAECTGELFRQDRQGVTIKQRDFLTVTPGEFGTFDAVVMNPPFHMRSDIRHIQHALTFLKPGGRLAAICLNGAHRREALKPLASTWIELPADTFKESGTHVQTALIVIDV